MMAEDFWIFMERADPRHFPPYGVEGEDKAGAEALALVWVLSAVDGDQKSSEERCWGRREISSGINYRDSAMRGSSKWRESEEKSARASIQRVSCSQSLQA